eukprot:6148940-Pyramimonas_sp.AAC.1
MLLLVLASRRFSEPQPDQQQSDLFQVLFGNNTERGPQVQNYIEGPNSKQFDCIAFVETHKGPADVLGMKTFLQKE